MVPIDGGPLALPAASRGSTEQHEHRSLDPSCRVCTGRGRHRRGTGAAGRPGLVWAEAATWIHDLGRWWQGVPGHLEKDLVQTRFVMPWAGCSLAAGFHFSSCLCSLQTGSPRVSSQAPSKLQGGCGMMLSREPQAKFLCPFQICPKTRRSL